MSCACRGRASAARRPRGCWKLPALYDAVARGELHLTGLLLLGPHLTEENLADVLARAKHRTKRELAKLVRELDPLPDVPARVEPLGPALMESPRNPTWSEFVASFNPVRELQPGERPADWLDKETDVRGEDDDGAGVSGDAAPARRDEPPAPARPQRHKVQFTATQEYVELLERARDLLSHAVPDRSFEAVHLRALRELVESSRRRSTPRRPAPARVRSAKPGRRATRASAVPPGRQAGARFHAGAATTSRPTNPASRAGATHRATRTTRAGATASPPPSAAPSASATARAAATSTRAASAAAKPPSSSSTTSSPSPAAGPPRPKTSACAAARTMRWRPRRISGAGSCGKGNRPGLMAESAPLFPGPPADATRGVISDNPIKPIPCSNSATLHRGPG